MNSDIYEASDQGAFLYEVDKSMKILIAGFSAIMAVGLTAAFFAIDKSKKYMKNLCE